MEECDVEPDSDQAALSIAHDCVFAGVAGGIAEYFAIDPTLARIVLFLALLPAGPFGVVVYMILVVIIPEAPVAELVNE